MSTSMRECLDTAVTGTLMTGVIQVLDVLTRCHLQAVPHTQTGNSIASMLANSIFVTSTTALQVYKGSVLTCVCLLVNRITV